jgi:ankyrin repeat protein
MRRADILFAPTVLFFVVVLSGRAIDQRMLEAVKQGETNVLLSIISNGGDVNARDSHGFTCLLYAIDLGQTNSAAILIAKGANPNPKGPKGLTPLALASGKGQTTIVQALLDKGADVNTPISLEALYETQSGRSRLDDFTRALYTRVLPGFFELDPRTQTPLMLAAIGNKVETARVLLENGASRDVADHHDLTALAYAAREGHIEFVRLLIEKGVNLNRTGEKALEQAELRGQSEMVEILVKALNPRSPKKDDVSEELLAAVNRGSYEQVKALIEKGANVNYTNSWGARPILWVKTNVEIARLLIERGADPQITPARGYGLHPFWSAVEYGSLPLFQVLTSRGIDQEQLDRLLIFAAQKDQTEIALHLIARGANVHAKDEAGHNALVYAVNECNQELIDRLRKKGAILDVPRVDKLMNPLLEAAASNNIEKVKRLLACGVDVNWPAANGKTPLGNLLSSGHYGPNDQSNRLAVAMLLLEKGANPNLRFSFQDPRPLLFYAISGGDVRLAEAMIEKGADPNGMFGSSALGVAIQEDRVEMVRILIAKGAHVNAKDEQGKTPLAIAAPRQNNQIIELLKGAGARD